MNVEFYFLSMNIGLSRIDLLRLIREYSSERNLSSSLVNNAGGWKWAERKAVSYTKSTSRHKAGNNMKYNNL